MGLCKWLKYFFSVRRQPVIDDVETLGSLGFEIVRELGAGSFGTVKLATSKKHEHNVAIKVMDRRWMTLQGCSKMLNAEIDTILKLNPHPHIVHVHEVIEVRDEQVFIVMEAAQCTLSDKLEQDGAFINNFARNCFSQIVSATEYMHEQDIVHRDLKCENILVFADNNVKVTDFGMCRRTKGFPEMCRTYCGTPYYLAPEVFNKKKYDGKKSDMWSLGVVLYVMVTAEFPNETSKTNELAHPKLPFTFPNDVEVDESCQALISDMLQLDPRARPCMREIAMHPWLQSNTDPSTDEECDSSTSEEDAECETSTSEDDLEEHGGDMSTPEDAECDTGSPEDDNLVDHSGAAVVSAEVVLEAAGTSINCPAVVVEIPFIRAVKRAAGSCAKALRKLLQKIKRFFHPTFSTISTVLL